MRFLIFISFVFISSCTSNIGVDREKQKFKSYIELRFSGVIRQNLDSSCGLASLSGVLIDGYGINATEEELLDLIGLKVNYSFSDLKYLADQYSKRSVPLWISYEKLILIERPTILYIKRKGIDHFVSLNYIDKMTIQIKDPAWGILNYTRQQFESYWVNGENKMGKALVFTSQSSPLKKESVYTKFINTNDLMCVSRDCA